MVWAPPAEFAPQSCGFVMAASGRKFATLAEQAARSLQQSNPGFEVDLWTDVTVDESLFAQVHPLEKSWFRPKFEAIVKSRFERTLYLDCDLVVIADLSDVFWLLDKMDIAGIHAPVRNAGHATSVWRMALPNSFPQINGGVMAVKRSDAAIRLFEDCQRALIEDALPRDQLVIRELLWLSDLRLGILPPEYNLRDAKLALVNGSSVSAPRILHNSRFSRDHARRHPRPHARRHLRAVFPRPRGRSAARRPPVVPGHQNRGAPSARTRLADMVAPVAGRAQSLRPPCPALSKRSGRNRRSAASMAGSTARSGSADAPRAFFHPVVVARQWII